MASTAWLESADYVRRLYDLYERNVADTQIEDLPASPPAAVAKRLAAVPLAWSSLPSLARRALLWDAGYVRSTAGAMAYVQVQTQCVNATGRSMASIAVRRPQYGGSTVVCDSARNATTTYFRQASSLGVVDIDWTCATQAPLANGASIAWSQDDLGPLTVPTPQVFMVLTDDAQSMFAIHTSPWPSASYGKCPAPNRPSGLVVPCVDAATAKPGLWCNPAPSSLMDVWLKQLHNPTVVLPTTLTPTTVRPTDTIVAPPMPMSQPTATGAVGAAVIVLGAAFGVTAVIVGVCFIAWFQRRLQEMIDATENNLRVAPAPVDAIEADHQSSSGLYGPLVTPKEADRRQY
ncbi:hypothetical protein SPRG_06132 [Saprolegnia parasitica CBS 223.65]|uniref:Uncharacterized protein n=1 Tax=Saprolegnia parasitica (strain CBS 223.65) TaxID=695850 RepID=A0A067CQI9_SAPPC|nr:hypothetical protein SPRG_06132 [Saprolegnia parasitica CBS 223.65]KDO29077.1 hypothetical protein SPRG_06132 [Saprolegnia parasitica CBS 223.65]|eukprot:XP_012200245.1 hypothetical protein SPRG_06132 [Saprolegnia parasitica CBS 223.65]